MLGQQPLSAGLASEDSIHPQCGAVGSLGWGAIAPLQLSPWNTMEERPLSPLQSSLSNAKAGTSWVPIEPTQCRALAETPGTQR